MTDTNNNDNFKQQKEQFVSGLEGTTPWELLLICSTSVVGTIFYYSTINLIVVPHERQQSKQKYSFCFYLTFEILSFWIPMVICQTVWLYPYGIRYMLCQVVVSFFAVVLKKCRWKSSSLPNNTNATPGRVSKDTILETSSSSSSSSLERTTVTVYRACLMFLTVTAILAVDFHIFPRRFGKTENNGYGFMDLGAASFVIAAGFVSTRCTKQQQPPPHQDEPTVYRNAIWSKQIQRMIPLLLMGSLRLVTHKGLDYPEHVSEYGVHWNFFFTIALLMPLASVASLFQSQPSWIVPVVVLTLYQYCLSMQGLQHWMEDAPRMCPSSVRMGGFPTNALLIFCDLWYANREGILGSVSYAALYLISEWFAYAFFWRQKHRPSALTTNAVVTNAWNVTAKLWLVVLALFLLWQSFVNAGGFVVSRRSTNAIFCTWVLFVNVLQLVAIYTFVLLGSLYHLFNEIHLEPPPILAAVNRNGLSIFIIANLLTGLVNISINTLTVHNGTAVSILIIYVSTVGLVGVLIDHVMSNLRTFHQNVFGRQQEHISSQGKDQAKKEN